MKRFWSFCFAILFLFTAFRPYQEAIAAPVTDNPQEDYLIMNGKLWRNLYLGIKGNPYFMTGEFLNGDITFNGRVFRDRIFKYDTYNDEIVLWINTGTTIILNKEMVSEFNINYLGEKYHIVNLGEDTTSIISGYVNVYYAGPTPLYVKYRKEIEILAVDNRYDLFIDLHRSYIKKDGQILQVSGKGELLKILSDRKDDLKHYIKTNKLRVTKKEPRSFIPVLEYYDKLRQ